MLKSQIISQVTLQYIQNVIDDALKRKEFLLYRCNESGFLYRCNLRGENPPKLHRYKQHKREIRRLYYCFQILKVIILINNSEYEFYKLGVCWAES